MSACDNYTVCKLPEKRKGVKGVLPSEARKADSRGGVLGEWGLDDFPVFQGRRAAYFDTLLRLKVKVKKQDKGGCANAAWGQKFHDGGLATVAWEFNSCGPRQLAHCNYVCV